MNYKRWIVIYFVVLNMFIIRNAYAYIDPGTGSLILQVLLGALLTGVFLIKLFFKRIKGFFRSIFQKGKKHEQSDI